jgi:hypothetical protein
MPLYKITIVDHSTNINHELKQYTGEVNAPSIDMAIIDIKEFYALELGTDINNIEIKSIITL